MGTAMPRHWPSRACAFLGSLEGLHQDERPAISTPRVVGSKQPALLVGSPLPYNYSTSLSHVIVVD
jgi:hypothetical protein